MSGLSEQEREAVVEWFMRERYGDLLAECDAEMPAAMAAYRAMYGKQADGILAARAEQARPEHVVKAEALREAARDLQDRWVQEGKHPGLAGCYSSGYEDWLRDRADALEVKP